MTNWCQNKLNLSAEKEKLLSFLYGIEKDGLFNSIIPTPKEFKNPIFWGKDSQLFFYDENHKKFIFDETYQKMLIEKYGTFKQDQWKKTNWGTSFEADILSDIKELIADVINQKDKIVNISIDFLSGWSPPLKFYEVLFSKQIKLMGYYYEAGNCFYGWFDGTTNHCFNFVDFEDINIEITKVFNLKKELPEEDNSTENNDNEYY